MPIIDHIAERETAYDKVEILSEHAHSASCIYPTLAAGVTATTAAGAWTLGNFVEVVPVNTITEDFDIHHINIEAVSADDCYEIVLYAETTEIGRVRGYVKDQASHPNWKFQDKLIAANSQIQAKVASSLGGAATMTISLHYHTY